MTIEEIIELGVTVDINEGQIRYFIGNEEIKVD